MPVLQVAIEIQWDKCWAVSFNERQAESNYFGGRVCVRSVARLLSQGKTLKQLKDLITLVLSDSGIDLIIETIHSAASTNFIYANRNNRG